MSVADDNDKTSGDVEAEAVHTKGGQEDVPPIDKSIEAHDF